MCVPTAQKWIFDFGKRKRQTHARPEEEIAIVSLLDAPPSSSNVAEVTHTQALTQCAATCFQRSGVCCSRLFFFNQRHRPSEFSEQRPSQSSVGISPIAETRWHQSRSRLCAVSQTTTIINSKITTTTTTAARPTRQKSKRTTFPGKKCFFFFDSLSCRRLLLLLFGLFYLFEYVNVTLYDDKKAHSPFCGR